MDEQLKAQLEELLNQFKSGMVSQADFTAKIDDLKAAIEGKDNSAAIAELKKALAEIGGQMEVIKAMGKGAAPAEDVVLKALNEAYGAEGFDAIKQNNGRMRDINVKAAALMTTAVTPKEGVLRLVSTEVMPGINAAPQAPRVILPLLLKSSSAARFIAWVNRKPKDGGAAFTAEGALKPLIDWIYETESSEAKKIAVRTKFTTELYEDMTGFAEDVNRLLRVDLLNEIERKLLTGTGNGAEILGVLTKASDFTLTSLNGTVDMPNYADAIRAVVLQITNGYFTPTTVLVNPNDKAIIDLAKDTTGHYLSAELRAVIGGLNIVETPAITQGSFVVLDASKWYARMYKDVTLKVGYENDDFSKNLLTVIAEARMHSYVTDVDRAAFVKGNFATIVSALAKTAATPAKA